MNMFSFFTGGSDQSYMKGRGGSGQQAEGLRKKRAAELAAQIAARDASKTKDVASAEKKPPAATDTMQDIMGRAAKELARRKALGK